VISTLAKATLCSALLALLCIQTEEAQAARGRFFSRPTTVRPYQRVTRPPQAPRQLAPKPAYPKGAKGTARQADLTAPLPKHKQAATKNVKDSPAQAGVHKRVVTHPSGRKDIYQSHTRKPNGDIGNPHSHVVLNKARQVESARTIDGKKLKDSGRHVPRQ